MNKREGTLIILSGPSGSGKDTVLAELGKKGADIQLSVSLTTRAPRDGEIDGVHYYFVSEQEFLKRIDENDVLEYAKYGVNYYGTPKGPVDKWLSEGRNVILKIEVQGAEKIRQMYPDAVSVFILPPSMKVLEQRLRGRESDTEEDIERRLNIARGEIERSAEYDYIVVNDELECAVNDVFTVIKAESFKSSKNKNKIAEVLSND